MGLCLTNGQTLTNAKRTRRATSSGSPPLTPEFEQFSFEDPTSLARCIKSDCEAYRVGSTPLCARHLREQEVSAGATSIIEPEVEAAAKAAGDRAMGEIYVGPDPDTNGMLTTRSPLTRC